MTDPPNHDLVKAFLEKQEAEGKKYAAFAIPVREGRIHLAVRNTPPHEGLYSAVGGKVEKGVSLVFPRLSKASFDLAELGYETPTSAAVREFCEEMYSCSVEEVDLSKLEIARLGCLHDLVTGVSCYMRLLHVPPREFHPDPRQIGKIAPLSGLSSNQINPLTRLALHILRDYGFRDQIPDLELPRFCVGGDEYVFTY